MCMITVMLCIKIVLDEKENLFYFQNYALRERLDKKYKEYGFTALSEYITGKVNPLSKNQIKDYFYSYGDKNIISFEQSFIKYNKEKDSFSLVYFYDNAILKVDEYRYDIVNGDIKYTYFNSVYINGRI
jgi:hypothetical protein